MNYKILNQVSIFKNILKSLFRIRELLGQLVDNEWYNIFKKYVCSVMIAGLKMFKGYGDSKQKAAKEVAKKAYIYIH
jgi:hypothetical protein